MRRRDLISSDAPTARPRRPADALIGLFGKYVIPCFRHPRNVGKLGRLSSVDPLSRPPAIEEAPPAQLLPTAETDDRLTHGNGNFTERMSASLQIAIRCPDDVGWCDDRDLGSSSFESPTPDRRLTRCGGAWGRQW